MDPNKSFTFIKRLAEKTMNGQIGWERTAIHDVFQTRLSKFIIRIGSPDEREFAISLYDEGGELMDIYKGDDFNFGEKGAQLRAEATGLIARTFDAARRKALGVERALDSLLGELDRPEQIPPPQGSVVGQNSSVQPAPAGVLPIPRVPWSPKNP